MESKAVLIPGMVKKMLFLTRLNYPASQRGREIERGHGLFLSHAPVRISSRETLGMEKV